MGKEIVVKCQECGNKLKTDEKFVGRKGKCPKCGEHLEFGPDSGPKKVVCPGCGAQLTVGKSRFEHVTGINRTSPGPRRASRLSPSAR